MKLITLWYRITENGKANHNHIEEGHSQHDKPQPIKDEYKNQLAWSKDEWMRKFGYLKDGKVVEEVMNNGI